MTRTLTVSDSLTIAVAPATAWEAVADVTLMGRWSPENLGARVVDDTRPGGSGPLRVGDRFVGRNRRGRFGWSTECTVTAADPGARFAFEVRRIGTDRRMLSGDIATWEYRFEPNGDGVLVTETWTDDRTWSDRTARVFDAVVTGGRTFADFQRGNVRRTLARLRTQLEQG